MSVSEMPKVMCEYAIKLAKGDLDKAFDILMDPKHNQP